MNFAIDIAGIPAPIDYALNGFVIADAPQQRAA